MDTKAPFTIELSLPPEQLQLLEQIKELSEKLLASQSNTVWLTTEEAAERLKVSKSTLNQWRKGGWLRYINEGTKIIRYRSDQLDEDVENRLGVKAYLKR